MILFSGQRTPDFRKRPEREGFAVVLCGFAVAGLVWGMGSGDALGQEAADDQAAAVVPESAAYLLVIDRSGSMTARLPSGKTRWEEMQAQAVEFIRNVPLESRIWIAVFDHQKPRPFVPPFLTEEDRQAVIGELLRQRPGGGTALYDTLGLAFEEAERLSQQHPGRQNVIEKPSLQIVSPQSGQAVLFGEEVVFQAQVGGPVNEVAPDEQAGRRRERFRRAMQLRHELQADDLFEAAAAGEFDRLVEEHAQGFRDAWRRFCEEHDPERTGHLPVRLLLPMLRRFRDRFEKALDVCLRARLVRQLGPGHLDDWGRQLKQIVTFQRYFELMSCRFLSHETAGEPDIPPPRLYLRPDVDPAALMGHLESARIAGRPETSPWLGPLPLAGFLFQEMPVQFQQGPDGRIAIAPWNSTDHPQSAQASQTPGKTGRKKIPRNTPR